MALHGGEVHADSAGLGHGSTFSVTLPLARASAIRRHAAAADSMDASLDGLRVVVVDDEADVRVAVSTLLERAGATVNALTSGAQIEETLVDFQPDVVVLDISMPEEDGYALMRRIRNLPAEYGGATPAISLTAHAKDEDRRQAMESGFQVHMTKPIDVPVFLSMVARLAGNETAPADALMRSRPIR